MPKIIENYTKERKEVLQKIFNILEITDTNKSFSLKKMDEDKIKQQNITDLEHDIKKYFVCSRWTYFSNKKRLSKRKYLSLIKAISKELNVKMSPLFLYKKLDNNKSKCETYYNFDF